MSFTQSQLSPRHTRSLKTLTRTLSLCISLPFLDLYQVLGQTGNRGTLRNLDHRQQHSGYPTSNPTSIGSHAIRCCSPGNQYQYQIPLERRSKCFADYMCLCRRYRIWVLTVYKRPVPRFDTSTYIEELVRKLRKKNI